MSKSYKKLFDLLIKNYQEILVNKSGKNHTYFFNLEQDDKKQSGFYSIDEQGNKWLSVDGCSAIFSEHYYEKLRSKYFDINNDQQKLFYNIEQIDLEQATQSGQFIINVIKSNTRQGTPRKFITNFSGEKVNIEMPFETISNFKF